jgi:hypothetical protein
MNFEQAHVRCSAALCTIPYIEVTNPLILASHITLVVERCDTA